MNRTNTTSRRRWLRYVTLGTAGACCSSWTPALATVASEAAKQGHHCVLLWMSGGPSQIDTFDMKPAHANGGPIKQASTSVPGIAFSEHLPKLAKQADSLAILRGMSTKEGDHERGTVLMRTGHIPGGPVPYPSIGCSLSKVLGVETSDLPNYVTIAPGPFARDSISPGFLGPKYMATSVAASAPPAEDQFAQLRVDYLNRTAGLSQERQRARLELWRSMQADFMKFRGTVNVVAQDTVYQSAIRMLGSDARDAFDLSSEPEKVREAYGRQSFGQGCLMARRLIERGVPLVEVSLGQGLAWDTHADNFAQVQRLKRTVGRRLGDVDVRTARSRVAGKDDDSVGGRVWSHAQNQFTRRPRSLSASLHMCSRRRWGRGRTGVWQDQRGWHGSRRRKNRSTRLVGDALSGSGCRSGNRKYRQRWTSHRDCRGPGG